MFTDADNFGITCKSPQLLHDTHHLFVTDVLDKLKFSVPVRLRRQKQRKLSDQAYWQPSSVLEEARAGIFLQFSL